MNNKNGFPYLTQSDIRWANDIMTSPVWQMRPDYIFQYGCLMTSLCNIYNDFFNKQMTPRELNNLIQLNKGYDYLDAISKYKRIEDQKAACFNHESAINWSVIIKILGIKEIVRNLKQSEIEIENPNKYYIVKLTYQDTGHYCNVLNKELKYFNVFSGKIENVDNNVLEIIEINFEAGNE